MPVASLFEAEKMTLDEAIEMTAENLRTYRRIYSHWAAAFSGGKDSASAVTLMVSLFEQGRVDWPESLTVFYGDTRLELIPLQISAMHILSALEKRGVKTQVVQPELDDRFFVYMFGRGVPPPSNTFRWCTPQLKVEPMAKALESERQRLGEKFLMITGVRLGESAARDLRIVTSCSRDGAECGQGWFQTSPPKAAADTLAPILHWRVCHVWDWLSVFAPAAGFPTQDIAWSYGGDEAAEINARTGCVGCNLVSRDLALDTLLKRPEWRYLEPLKRLRPMYAELKKPHNRLRKPGGDRIKSGELAANQQRMGPLTMDARRWGLDQVTEIENKLTFAATKEGRPAVSLINPEEYYRILALIDANTWPDGWTGEEPHADVILDKYHDDGSVQPLMDGMFEV
jgi:DNA sulfur modification protein DndC